jgi:hypothetical protein
MVRELKKWIYRGKTKYFWFEKGKGQEGGSFPQIYLIN